MAAQSRLLTVAALTAALVVAARAAAAQPAATSAVPLLRESLATQEQAIRTRRVSSRQLVAAALARAHASAFLNIFITLDDAGAQRAADAADAAVASGGTLPPLLGVPVVIKDNIAYAGLPTSDGTAALRSWVPSESAPVAKAMTDAGAIVIGKTNMHELAFGITSANATFGAVGNPYAPADFAGGSSGGTAAAIAAGIVTAGLGSDTGGSARIPAALCGIEGFRPTVGRYSSAGVVPISHTRDTPGVMASHVADIATIDGLLAHDTTPLKPIPLKQIRLGVPRGYFYANLDTATAGLARATLALLRARGVTLVEADVPNIADLNDKVSFPVVLFEVMQDLPKFLADNNTGVTMPQLAEKVASPDVQAIVQGLMTGKATIPQPVYAAAMSTSRPALQQAYATYFTANRVDAMIFPTTPLPAQPIATSTQNTMLNGKSVPTFPTFIHNTDPDSNAGIPGISLRMGMLNGLPLGIEIDGPTGSDRHLLAIALSLEAALPPMTAPPGR